MGFVSDIDWGALQGELPQGGGSSDGIDWGAMAGELPQDPFGGWQGPIQQGDGNGSSIIKRIVAGLAGKPGANGNPNSNSTNAGDLSSVLGAFSSGEKANRYMQGNFTQGYDNLMLQAQKDRNSTESDALKKLAQTSYIGSGGSSFKPASFQLNGKTRTAPDLGYGPKAPTDAEKSGAAALQGQLQSRLTPGGTYTPQPLSDYAKPGTAENIGSYGAAGAGGLGAIMNILGGDGQTGANGVGSTLSGISKGIGTAGSIAGMLGKGGGALGTAGTTMSGILGKAVPIAGIAAGAYGLGKNQSVGSDTLSGMGAGASIGSFFPGIGTAVGAGVGALVGALRGAFSVTGKEHGGRDTQAQITQNLSKLATPQQMAEAQKAGWPDPNQALSLIVMRDKLTQSGLPPQQAETQAESIMRNMWDSEKSGSDSVTQAASPIQSMMGPSFKGATPPPSVGSAGPTPYPAGTDAFSRNARG